jgi:ABC-type Fe3+-siderophore transport system permease subunit
VKLTLEGWAGLATYACALLLCVRGLVRYPRKPRQTRRPGLGLAIGAGIAASVAAMIVLLLADGSSGAALRLQRWLLWPAVVVFAGSLAVMICVYLLSRIQRRCAKG